ncbi:hypothetical protein HWV62_42860 [Athelia sp. TMB]|nr:hypothetical protein HWV62_42860 [Athelia sp. TMB]
MPGKTAPYGTWESPITAKIIMGDSVTFTDVLLDPVSLVNYRIEARPSGRCALVNTTNNKDVVSDDKWDVQTQVHDYGGAAAIVYDKTAYFSNNTDNRVYSVKEGGTPQAITPEDTKKYHRFANFAVSPQDQSRIVAILEDHANDPNGDDPQNVINTLYVINTTRPTRQPTQVKGLPGLPDFYSCPCFNTDGTKLAWLQWYFPDMPWEGSELWVADVEYSADSLTVVNPKLVSGEKLNISVAYPVWADAVTLIFTNDSSGFINPWKYSTITGKAQAILSTPIDEDFAPPAWPLGYSPYAVVRDTTLGLFTAFRAGANVLYYIDYGAEQPQALEIESPFASVAAVRANKPGQPQFIFQSEQSAEVGGIIQCILSGGSGSVAPTPTYTVLKTEGESLTDKFPPGIVSLPIAETFHISPEIPLYALLYKPVNPDYSGSSIPGEKPPCIINVHGGPTSLCVPTLDWVKQYYTSRGWAWLDVNYGGSSGYGREYIALLATQWGIKDVSDCFFAAQSLANDIDTARVTIRGASSGGYTSLAAISFGPNNTFYKASTSYSGVADLALLAKLTHKFELKYMNKLLGGSYEEIPKVYDEDRSPIFNAKFITAPLLLISGALDEVVPPEQSAKIKKAVTDAGHIADSIVFPDEGHHINSAKNKITALEGERTWYEKYVIKPKA